MDVTLTAPDWATHLMSDLTDWQRAPVPVAEITSFTLPDDAYFEYAFVDAQGERRPDPANARPRLNPWWTWASNLQGPDFHFDELARLDGIRPAGEVRRLTIESEILSLSRRIIVYSPPGLSAETLPVVYFQDGKAYWGWGNTPQVLDGLLAARRCAPAHLVFIPPGERTKEYFFNPRYRRFVIDEVLPAVEKVVSCNGERSAFGASLGGLLSAQLAWEHPDVFQTVVTQSGAFLFSRDMTEGDPFHGNEEFIETVAAEPLRPLRWFLDCGRLEWFVDSNKKLLSVLLERGGDVRYQERNAGHNWVSWKNGLPAALSFACGLPDQPAVATLDSPRNET